MAASHRKLTHIVLPSPHLHRPQTTSTTKSAQKLPTPPELDEDDEFELDEIDEDDSADDDFAPSAAAATSKRPRRASTQTNSSGSNQSAYHGSSVSPQLTATGGKPSNRKVSHSLIERRRREKINDW